MSDDIDQDLSNVSDRQWNIFIARGIMNNKAPGFLTGYCKGSSEICILGVVAENVKSERVVGYWHGENKQLCEDEEALRSTGDQSNFINKYFPYVLHVWSKCTNNINCYCYLVDRGKQKNKPPVCILFSPEDILYSYIMIKSEVFVPDNAKEMPSCTNAPDSIISDTIGERIGHALRSFLVEKRLPEETLVYGKQKTSSFASALKGLICFFPYIVTVILSFLHLIFNSSFPLANNLLCILSFPKHLMSRCRRSHEILKVDKRHYFHKLVKYNVYAQHLFESLIGIAVLYYVLTNNLADSIASSVLDWADDVARRSDDLIKWLMGAPAGLKLNSQLTSMLGHFFIYHIYIWTGYLQILRTVLPWFLLFASWVGVLGVSFQLCIVKDIISMLTLHIYSFYVYAARIFNLQVSTLSSLWRLFRGKKWNSLRSRVDSAEYHTDQLFVGTLLFTVLLFLLPTTALYYTVFTGLRIVTVIAQGILSRLIGCISVTPVYSILLYLFRPKWIAGCVEFDIIHSATPPSSLILSLRTSQLSLAELIRLTAPYLKETGTQSSSWSELIACVMSGKILYPWRDITVTDNDTTDKKTKVE